MQLNPQAKTAKYYQIKLEELVQIAHQRLGMREQLKFRDALKSLAESVENSDLHTYYHRRK